MTEAMLGLMPTYGPLAVFVATVVSCFGVPVPGALVLLAGGSFVASGEMTLAAVLFSGLGGAIIGNQAGYWLGEAVWVCGYIALGYAFSQSVVAISALLGDLAWVLAAGATAILLGLRVRAAAQRAFHQWSHRPTI